MSSPDVEQVSGGPTKICPYCGESILEVAKVCRYCSRDLVSRLRRKPLLFALAALIVLALVTSGAFLLSGKDDAVSVVNEALNCQSSKNKESAKREADKLNYIATCTIEAVVVDFYHQKKGEPTQFGFDPDKAEAAMKCAQQVDNEDEPEKTAKCLVDKGLLSAK